MTVAAGRVNQKTGKEVRPRPQNNKYDWDTLRRNFIEGIERANLKEERWYPSLRELAELHEVPYIRIRKRSAEERWTNKREAAQNTAMQERNRRRARQVAKNAMDFDEKNYNLSKVGIALITTRLGEIASEVAAKKDIREHALAQQKAGVSVDRADLWSAIRADEINALANAADRLQSVGMKALGTDVTKVDIMGGETNVTQVNITQEIMRDDPDRMSAMMEAMVEAKMFPGEILDAILGAPETEDDSNNDEDDNVIDAEVEDEDDEDGQTEDVTAGVSEGTGQGASGG